MSLMLVQQNKEISLLKNKLRVNKTKTVTTHLVGKTSLLVKTWLASKLDSYKLLPVKVTLLTVTEPDTPPLICNYCRLPTYQVRYLNINWNLLGRSNFIF